MSRATPGAVPILMYHQVTPRPDPAFHKYAITPEAFREQMEWLKSAGYAALSLEALYENRVGQAPLPPRPIVITFDDGFQDCMDFAVPTLVDNHLTATFYVVAGLIDQTSRWLQGKYGVEFSMMSWGSIRDLEAAGLACGAHGMSHANLTTVDSATCREELRQSRAVLEDGLGHEVLDLAYPYGGYDETVRAIAVESGYRTACSVRPGWSPPDDDLMALRRLHVLGGWSLADFIHSLRSHRSPMRLLRAGASALRRKLGAS